MVPCQIFWLNTNNILRHSVMDRWIKTNQLRAAAKTTSFCHSFFFFFCKNHDKSMHVVKWIILMEETETLLDFIFSLPVRQTKSTAVTLSKKEREKERKRKRGGGGLLLKSCSSTMKKKPLKEQKPNKTWKQFLSSQSSGKYCLQ